MTTATIPKEVLEDLAVLRAESLDPNMPECPPWCRLDTGHGWDSLHEDGRVSRGHQGPHFGEYVSTGSRELRDAVGVQEFDVCVDPRVEPEVETAEQARELAADLIAGAEWVEAQR